MSPFQWPKVFLQLVCFLILSLGSFSQTATVNQIKALNTPAKGLEALRFLAADELMGRATLRPEIHIAARYISEAFRAAGLKEVSGTSDYYQSFTIQMVTSANSGSLQINGQDFMLHQDWIQLSGKDLSIQAPIIFAHHGTKQDLDKLDIKGKIVVTEMGADDSASFMDGFNMSGSKQSLVRERGGLALIERFKKAEIPWKDLLGYAMSERPLVEDAGENSIPVCVINDSTGTLIALLQKTPSKANLVITGTQTKTAIAKNVMGWVEGTDPVLKHQFVLLSAHYDHIGVAKNPVMEEGKLDSIYNGARDNAIGSTAVIDAARFFAKYPPKRSVLFMTYTAEEIGLIGSSYFADHPLIPLRRIVYNLNIDNASYNDISIVTVIGLGRTSADAHIIAACKAFGLKAVADPEPAMSLFDRSDNVSIAAKGVPAPTFSLGFTKFDSVVNKRYHQLSDEVGNFDLSYAMKYINSFILAAKYIADDPARYKWKKGDKYEAVSNELYK